ncbi:MAG: type III polyketide synthase [Actinobacteria bacterium]|nr:type III polyketide synthase [Actinomycetota bacterium]
MDQTALWNDHFADHYAHDPRAERIWHRVGVDRRHGVADPRTDDISDWSTGQRMRRFVDEALPLGREAISRCLDRAQLAPEEVGQLTVATCTGYATPGLDILLARDLGMSARTQRLHVGHMGCYAAIPALAATADAAAARGRTGVLLCVELTSLHAQPAAGPDPDMQQVVAHALFSDAAAAVAVRPSGAGPRVVDVVSRTDVEHALLMRWDITDLGFRMGLSPEVPDVLSQHVEGAVDELLTGSGLHRRDVVHWAIHPGGPAIIDVVAERLGLDDEAVRVSREVLAEHGNCSSATILLILDRIMREADIGPGDPIVAMAFGPGLTLYAALLRG